LTEAILKGLVMPRFAANLTMLFTEIGFLDRFDAARKAGFDAVEFLFPYAFPAEEISRRLRDNGLQQVLFNLPAGDWDRGERGIGCHPDRVQEFRDGIDRAIAYADALACRQINCLAGIKPTSVSGDKARDVFVENLAFAANKLSQAGIAFVIEAINTRDIPGFFLAGSAQTMAIINAVGSSNLKMQYDIYHMQRMEGELAATMETLLPRIGHIQLADNPGRNEPGTGEINYPFLFRHLDRIGYNGWIGCEYRPLSSTEAGLSWLTTAKSS
jgi:hydroxypyruvate isomerase